MYRLGYFRQHLDAEGWQEERYPVLDPHGMALELVDGARGLGRPGRAPCSRPRCGGPGSAGSSCTCSTPTSTPTTTSCAAVTDRLYGGGTEHRIRQEILLGIGGVRALEAAGVETQVFHTNEGHAGFLGLERIRKLITDRGAALGRGRRGGPGRHRLHHPHPGARPASTASPGS